VHVPRFVAIETVEEETICAGNPFDSWHLHFLSIPLKMFGAVPHIRSATTNAPEGYKNILAQIAIAGKEKGRIQDVAETF
jgi:hypothetical protein